MDFISQQDRRKKALNFGIQIRMRIELINNKSQVFF